MIAVMVSCASCSAAPRKIEDSSRVTLCLATSCSHKSAGDGSFATVGARSRSILPIDIANLGKLADSADLLEIDATVLLAESEFPATGVSLLVEIIFQVKRGVVKALCEEQIGDSSSRSRTIDLVTTRREVKSKFLCTPGGASSDARPPHPMMKRRAQIRRSVAVETAQVGWKSSATRFEFASKEDVDRGKQLINVFAPQLSHRSTASSATRRGALGAAAVDPLRRCLQWPALLGPLGVESNDMETAEEIAGARRGCLLLRLAARLDPGTIRGCSR